MYIERLNLKGMISTIVNNIVEQYFEITSIKCTPKILYKGESHVPTTLQKGEQGVYVFYNDDICELATINGTKS